MAALGAGAGAFEGDNARAEQRANMARLSLQGAQLALDERQFQAGRENDLYQRGRNERQDDLDERKFQAGRENDLYQRGRNERQDAWKEALNAQEIMERQERIKTNRLQFEELDRAAKMEREKLANRQRLAKTGLGALALSALRNGGIASPAAIEVFNKQQEAAGTGIRVTGGVWSKEGFVFTREGPAVDQNGQPIQGEVAEYDEVMNPAIARVIFKDEFEEDFSPSTFGPSPTGKQSKLSKAEERLLNIRLGRIERERSDILKELAPEDAKELLGDKEYQKLKDRLIQLDKDEEAAVYSAYGENISAPSGAQGGGAVGGYTEQQMNELGVLKGQALREANGDNAKALDIFRQKKKQWELSQVNPAEQSSVHQDVLAEHGSKASLEKNDVSLQKETDRTQRRTGVYDTNGSRFGRKPDFGSSSRNAHSSASSTLIKNESNTDLSPEDKKAMTEIFYESLNNPIDPVTRLPIDPVEYRRMKEAEYFKAKRDGDQKRMKELFGL